MFCLILSSFSGTSVRFDENSISRIFNCPGVARSEAEGDGTKILDLERVGSWDVDGSPSAATTPHEKTPQTTNPKRQATTLGATK
jgi:hypothetical protein